MSKSGMSQTDEHDDDLESEVTEGAAFETDQYEEADDDKEITAGADVTNAPERPESSDKADGEDLDDAAADTI
jgi:hypothetical protein